MKDVQLNASERDDLRYILSHFDGAAQRLMAACENDTLTPDAYGFSTDDGRLTCACAWGWGVGNGTKAVTAREPRAVFGDDHCLLSPMERYLKRNAGPVRPEYEALPLPVRTVLPKARNELKVEILVWLAEQGQHPEPSPRNLTESPELVHALAH